MKKPKFDSGKVLGLVSMGLGLAGMLLNNKMEANSRKEMKSELKEEIMKEFLNNQKN